MYKQMDNVLSVRQAAIASGMHVCSKISIYALLHGVVLVCAWSRVLLMSIQHNTHIQPQGNQQINPGSRCSVLGNIGRRPG